MSLKIGDESKKLAKAIIERKILPSITETLKNLRDPLIEKDTTCLDISPDIEEALSPLLKGDIFSSMNEIHSVALTNGLRILKYAVDHPDEFNIEKLIKEADDSMDREG